MRKKYIHPSDIRKELQCIWEIQKEEQKTRACLFTLIIYTKNTCQIEYLEKLVKSIIDLFPCRIIFLFEKSKMEEEYIHVSVSAHSINKKKEPIYCDQIDIESTPQYLIRIPFLILPLIVPDLPVYLIWGFDPAKENKTLSCLRKFSSRFIIDSEMTSNLTNFARLYTSEEKCESENIIDLNWARLSEWRYIFTKTFCSPNRIKALSQSKTIEISYNSQEDKPLKRLSIQALYLQAWLASRFSWSFQDMKNGEKKTSIRYKNESGESLKVFLKEENRPQIPPGSILSVELFTHNDHRYSVKRLDLSKQIEIKIETPEKCFLPYTLPISSQSNNDFSFLREIFYSPSNAHYRRMLKAIANQDIHT